jgi:hypothetical protein
LPIPGAQFRYTELFGTDDYYFGCEFQDNQFYKVEWQGVNKSSNQVGHFLTGVSFAYDKEFSIDSINIRLMISHEQTGDFEYNSTTDKYGGEGKPIIYQILNAPFVAATDIIGFTSAIAYDEQGRYAQRDAELWDLLRFSAGTLLGGVEPGRVGNSLQDLRLDVRAWRFGNWVLDHPGGYPGTGKEWLLQNLR